MPDDEVAAVRREAQLKDAGGRFIDSVIKAGKDIDYDGVSGPIEFNDKGDPSEATVSIYQFGDVNIASYVEGKSGKI